MTIPQIPVFENNAIRFEKDVRAYFCKSEFTEYDFKRLTEMFINNSDVIFKEVEVIKIVEVERKRERLMKQNITISDIELLVCDFFGVELRLLKAKTRKREIVQARQITMHLSKIFTKHSLKTIGIHFGGRDHTTVIHSCQTVKDLMDSDNVYKAIVESLIEKMEIPLDQTPDADGCLSGGRK